MPKRARETDTWAHQFQVVWHVLVLYGLHALRGVNKEFCAKLTPHFRWSRVPRFGRCLQWKHTMPPPSRWPDSITSLDLWIFSDPLLSLPTSLTSLHLGMQFDHDLPTLPSTLTSLHLGSRFTRTLPALPSSLITLHLGDGLFNRALPLLPDSLTTLILSHNFNQSLTLPESLTTLRMGFCFDQLLPSLPPRLEHLVMRYSYSHALPLPLPDSLKILEIGTTFCKTRAIPRLPRGLRQLRFTHGASTADETVPP